LRVTGTTENVGASDFVSFSISDVSAAPRGTVHAEIGIIHSNKAAILMIRIDSVPKRIFGSCERYSQMPTSNRENFC
jgi:hypothetical protein